MLKKLPTIFTSMFLSLIMIMNMILPACAINENSEMGAQIKSGVYCIQSMVGDNKFCDVFGPFKEDTTPIQVWTKHEYVSPEYAKPAFLNQEFYFWYDPSHGCYTIIPMYTVIDGNKNIVEDSPKCIGVEKSVAGDNVVQRALSFEDNFKWKINHVGNGQYEFTLKSNDKLKLEVCKDEHCYHEGSFFQVNNENKSNAQKFKLSEWVPSKKGINNANAQNARNDIDIKLKKYRNGESLQAEIEPGVYRIQSAASANKVLDISGGSKDDVANLTIWESYGGPNQQCYLWYDPSDGYYTMLPMHCEVEKCIGIIVMEGVGQKYNNTDFYLETISNGQYGMLVEKSMNSH